MLRINRLAVLVLATRKVDHADVLEVGPSGLLVDGTFVQSGVTPRCRVDGIQMQHWQRHIQHLWVLLGETRVFLVPPGAIKEEAVDVDALLRRRGYFLLCDEAGHVVGHDHHVKCPSFVGPGDLLSHRRVEALCVEKSSHPEGLGAAIETPTVELGVAVKELGEPETKRGGHPRNLLPQRRDACVIHVVKGVLQLGRHDDGAFNRQQQLA
mmetsp:Transcript_483/g.1379  ORF Transcript_483/g.1379 Transcript_483/m.1379 type:complete len:210 (-) Transcript_483:7210-7839(-)